jgi:hypothetical protein
VEEITDDEITDDEIMDEMAALWEAVVWDKPDDARELAAAGVDPWRPVMVGWSPGRLSLAGPTPDLFEVPDGERGLSEAERAAVRESRRLLAALGDLYCEGTGLACVGGIDADEAARRLEATPRDHEEFEELLADRSAFDWEANVGVMGLTTVPGGCVVTQPWGFAPSMPGVQTRLSAGTLCYGLFANPKSGDQGSITRDGVIEGWDLLVGGGLHPDDDEPADTPEDVLAAYLYRLNAVAYACAYAGLRLTDARAVTGPPELWVSVAEAVWKG